MRRMHDVDLLLNGSIDMHLHHGPAPRLTRVDAFEAACQAQQAGMKAIVLKSHYYPTTPLAIAAGQSYTGVKVFGSICLELETGGLNFHALELSAKLGAKVVWMPTFSSANSRNKMRKFGFTLVGDGISILDGNGCLVPEISPVLDVINKYDLILANGHLSPAETFALFKEAKSRGINKLVVTHPLDSEFVDQSFDLEELVKLGGMGAYIELTSIGLLPTEFSHDPLHMVKAIEAIGAEHCIMGTDLGELAYNPTPSEGMRLFIATLLCKGVSFESIETMCKKNPAFLLGLEASENV